MTDDAFWDIIAKSRTMSDGTWDSRQETLATLLSALPPAEIVEYERIFGGYQKKAYTWDLWGVAYIIGGGCSDDGFIDFRAWLISLGKDAYAKALRDPESLAAIEFGPGKEEEAFWEEFGYIGMRVYEELTGSAMSDIPGILGPMTEPTGEEWDEDDLPVRFPRVWAQHGESD